MHPHALPDAKIKHNLLTTTRDSIGPDIPVQPLDLATLPAAGVAQAAKDLTGLAGAELKGDGGLGLETGDGAAEAQHGLGLVHLLALVDDVLEPVVRGLDLAGHVRELQADDGVLDELLAESAALVGVLDGLLVADTGEAQALDDDADTLVVEVGHDNAETLVLLAEQVLDGDLYVLKGDVGGSAGPDSLAVHAAGADTLSALNEEQGDTVHALSTCPHGSSEVVSPDTVSDPLLLAVDNVVLAILTELSLASQVGDVATGIRLRNGQADTLVTAQDAWQDTVLESRGTKLDERWAADTVTTNEVPHETTRASPGELISQQHLMEEIPLLDGHTAGCGSVLCGILDTQKSTQVASATHLLVDFLGHALGLVPFGDIRLNVLLDPLANLGSQGGVRLIEVRGGVLSAITC